MWGTREMMWAVGIEERGVRRERKGSVGHVMCVSCDDDEYISW